MPPDLPDPVERGGIGAASPGPASSGEHHGLATARARRAPTGRPPRTAEATPTRPRPAMPEPTHLRPAVPTPTRPRPAAPPATEAVRGALLLGRDHRDLGDLAVERLDADTAIALSPGWHAKRVAQLDPNEDVVFAASGPAGRLLAAADAHAGCDSAEAAVAAIAAHCSVLDAPRIPRPARVLGRMLVEAQDAVARALEAASGVRARGRTALAVALVTDRRLYAAVFGDVKAARVRGRRVRVCRLPAPRLDADTRLPGAWTMRLRRGDWVLVASNGVTGYAEAWRRRTPGLLDTDDAAAGARALAEAAWAGGAGDDIAVGLTRVATMPVRAPDHAA